MKTHGIIQNGAIVIKGGIGLPEGMRILVSIEPDLPESKSASHHVQFPLVHSVTPGRLNLTNKMLADFLDEDEIPR